MRVIAAVCLLCCWHWSACAQVVVAQRSSQGHVDPLDFGQSFTAPRDFKLGTLRLSVSASNGGSDLTARFYRFDRSTLTLSPVVLASGTIAEAQLSTSPAWIELALTPQVELTATQTYAFTIQAADPGGITGWNNYGTSFNDVYSDGEFFFGLAGRVSTQTNLKELAFELVAVPERSSLVAACMLLGFIARRKRKGTSPIASY